jgi:hypothetical protein
MSMAGKQQHVVGAQVCTSFRANSDVRGLTDFSYRQSSPLRWKNKGYQILNPTVCYCVPGAWKTGSLKYELNLILLCFWLDGAWD